MLVSTLFLCGVFGIYHYALDQGGSIDLARTMALNTLVVMEIFHLFFIRNLYGTSLTWDALKGTRAVWLVVVLIAIAQLSITCLPPMQRIFATEAIPFRNGLLIVAIGVSLFLIIETEKQIRLVFRRMKEA